MVRQESEIALTKLLNELTPLRSWGVDSYLRQARAVIIPR
jgi:hypothetical protein